MKIHSLASVGSFTLITYKDTHSYHFNILNSTGDIYTSSQTYSSAHGAELAARLMLGVMVKIQ